AAPLDGSLDAPRDAGSEDAAEEKDGAADSPDALGDAGASDADSRVTNARPCGVLHSTGPELLDLDTRTVSNMSVSKTRFLASSVTGKWRLWDSATGARVAGGDGGGEVALTEDAAIVVLNGHLLFIDPRDGSILNDLPAHYSEGGFARDGSYFWT